MADDPINSMFGIALKAHLLHSSTACCNADSPEDLYLTLGVQLWLRSPLLVPTDYRELDADGATAVDHSHHPMDNSLFLQ